MQNTTTTHPNTLDDYVDFRELLPQVAQTFPTEQSLKWFIRQHRNELVKAAALIVLTGRLRFHPQRFKEAAVVIGSNLARRETLGCLRDLRCEA